MNTYAQILESAERHFVRFGYERTTMNQIAQDIGLSKGALYYFFKNKSELFCKVVDCGLEILEDYTKACIDSSESDEIIVMQMIQKYVDMAYDNSGIVLMLLGGQLFGDSSSVSIVLKKRLFRLQNTVEQIIQIGIECGFVTNTDPSFAAKSFLGMLYGIISLPNVPSKEETVTGIYTLLNNGLYKK